jgi:cell division protein FtsB
MIVNMKDARFRRGALLALVLIAFALTVHEVFGERGYFALRRRRQELQTLQEQVKHLQQENQQLEQEIKSLKTDPKAIEKLAREQMKLAKPGEIIYVLPEKKDPPAPSAAQSKDKSK